MLKENRKSFCHRMKMTPRDQINAKGKGKEKVRNAFVFKILMHFHLFCSDGEYQLLVKHINYAKCSPTHNSSK